MKKKIKFYFRNPEAKRVSDGLHNSFGLVVKAIGTDFYTLEELNQITDILSRKMFEIEINKEYETGIEIRKEDIEYKNKKCKNCIFLDNEYGCANSSSKTKSKHLKTSNSKACYWGVWKSWSV